MSFFRIALKNILRRPLRTGLTLCGVAAGIAAFTALVGFSRSFEQEWLKLYESSGTDLAVVQQAFLNTSVDQSVGLKLRALPGVAAAEPMLLNLVDLTPDVNALVYGWSAGTFELDSLTILQGRRFRDGSPEVMLGEVLADNLRKSAGSSMEIQGATFQVVGVFHGGSALEAGAAIMPIDQLQRLTDLEGKVTAFHVRVRRPAGGESAQAAIDRVRGVIETAVPGLKAVPAEDRARSNQLVVLARSTAWGTSVIALFIGTLGIANTMAMSVFERTREIGVFRALGWKKSRIMKLILLEAAALGLAGGCLGIAGGWVALRVLAALPATASFVTPSIPLTHCAQSLGIAVGIGLLAGLAPAWRGSRLSPVESLRYE
jgi:putative ABC transport system permease protein